MVHSLDADIPETVVVLVLVLTLTAGTAAGSGRLLLHAAEAGNLQNAEVLSLTQSSQPELSVPLASTRGVAVGHVARGTFNPAAARSASSSKLIHSNTDMGVLEFSFRVVFPQDVKAHGISFLNSELKVYLKQSCSGAAVSIAGFAGLLPLNNAQFTSSTYFYKQPAELQQDLRLFVRGATHEGSRIAAARPLHWGDKHGSDMGFWPFRGRYTLRGNVSLVLDGNQQTHLLPQMNCSSNSRDRSSTSSSDSSSVDSASGSSSQPSKQAVLNPGLWNVVTTPSYNQVPVGTLARLLLLHSVHHQQLGLQGTLLRCNPEEAEALILLDDIQQELREHRLVIWPWNLAQHTVSMNASHLSAQTARPYFWQVPRNQLAMLAAHGQPVKLAYFDLDEYLILPPGQTVQDASCQGLGLLDAKNAAWNVLRYAARCSNCSDAEIDCWEGILTVSGAAASSSTNHGTSHTEGSAAGQGSLLVPQCPCLLGKPIINPGLVENTKIHKVAVTRGHHSRQLEPQCGYLLHMQALVSNKRPWSKKSDEVSKEKVLLEARWSRDVPSPGTLVVMQGDRSVLSARECLAKGYSLLTHCAEV